MPKRLDNIVIRNGVVDDLPFIFSTWLKGLRYGNSYFKNIDKNVYFEHYKRIISTYLQQPISTISIDCLEDDKDVVLGYCVRRAAILDWIFVKKAWRRLGIASKLLEMPVTQYTHFTEVGLQIAPKDWIYNPFE